MANFIKRRTRPRRGPLRCPKFMAWIKTELSCLVCGRRPADPCHTSNNGTSSKGPDSGCVPLCREHHREFDAGRKAFEAKHRVNMAKIALVLWRLWNDAQMDGSA